MQTHSTDRWLPLYSKVVVVTTLWLIFVGGHTTSSGAGMAFPDWPLSNNSVNPDGWWTDFMKLLEHGHRATATVVAVQIGILCAWIWRNKWAFPAAVVVSIIASLIGMAFHAPRQIMAHLGIWSAAITFAVILFRQRPVRQVTGLQWIVFAAFLLVCVQAVLGGLRVTQATVGNLSVATTMRIIHGPVAQLELCLLVCIAVLVSPKLASIRSEWVPSGVLQVFGMRISTAAWTLVALLAVQLVFGSIIRHTGAGLVIPTFPHADPSGSWLPASHGGFGHLHFTHSRFGAVVIALFAIGLVIRMCAPAFHRLQRQAAIIVGVLVIGQILLGISVIWTIRQPMITTFHVLNGALLLASAVLLALRLQPFVSDFPSTTSLSQSLPDTHPTTTCPAKL